MTTGCLHVHFKISSERLFWIQKKIRFLKRISSEDADRKRTPLRAREAVPNAFFYCQINVRYWQITGKYVSFTFQKWTDLGHVLPNCGQCLSHLLGVDIIFRQSDQIWYIFTIIILNGEYVFIYSMSWSLFLVDRLGTMYYYSSSGWEPQCVLLPKKKKKKPEWFSGFWSAQKSSHNCLWNYFPSSQRETTFFFFVLHLIIVCCLNWR